jgi:hypothetical protein
MRLSSLLAVMVVLLMSAPATAAMLHHHDLCSLFVMSEAVVRAERVKERKVNEWERVETYRVTATWQGPLKVGDTIEVAGSSSYADDSPFSQQPPRKAGPTRVLFLRPVEPKRQKKVGASWWIVPSGMRVAFDGKVQRYQQVNNPGPYVPHPQGRDPLDVLGLPGGDVPTTWREFEGDLARAKDRADRIAAAIAGKAIVPLLDALGPPLAERRHGPLPNFGFFRDHAALAILERLDEIGDLASFLEGVSRLEGGFDLRHPRLGKDLPALIAFARAGANPMPRRLAALSVLGNRWPFDPPPTASSVLPLLADRSPEFRAAAVGPLTELLEGPDLARAIEARWKVEPDPGVQLVLWDTAQSPEIPAKLPWGTRPPVLTRVTRRRDIVAVQFGWREGDAWHLAGAKVVVTKGGDVVEDVELVGKDGPSTWHSQHRGGASLRIPTVKLAAGNYRVAITVRLKPATGDRAITTDHDLGAWALPAAPALPKREVTRVADPRTPSPNAAGSSEARAPHAPSASPSNDPAPATNPAPTSRDCACSSPGSRPADGGWILLLAGAALCGGARRRHAVR